MDRWYQEFDEEVKRAIDGTIFGIIGQEVLRSLYRNLKDHYNITPDEVPNHVDILFEILEHTFGFTGARTVSKAIAKRLYFRFDLKLVETENYRLQDYVEQAKKELSRRRLDSNPTTPEK